METTQVNRKQIDDLRAWFFAKDRSISLAQNTLYYLFTNQANGAYMSMAFISETVLSASAASVTFSNIPQNFRHLLMMTQARTDAVLEADTILVRFNNDSSANYDRETISATGAGITSAASRGSTAAQGILITEGASSRAFNFSPGYSFIFNYPLADREKQTINLSVAFGDASADTDLLIRIITNRWRNKNPITSIVLVPSTGPNFVSGSRFQLYGIL